MMMLSDGRALRQPGWPHPARVADLLQAEARGCLCRCRGCSGLSRQPTLHGAAGGHLSRRLLGALARWVVGQLQSVHGVQQLVAALVRQERRRAAQREIALREEACELVAYARVALLEGAREQRARRRVDELVRTDHTAGIEHLPPCCECSRQLGVRGRAEAVQHLHALRRVRLLAGRASAGEGWVRA